MSQFKKGQFIKVQKNGFLGYIHETDQNNYYLEWQNLPQEIFPYLIQDIDQSSDWTLSPNLFTYQALPSGAGNQRASSDQCSHNFQLYVGFSESYRYCTKCDKKLFLK